MLDLREGAGVGDSDEVLDGSVNTDKLRGQKGLFFKKRF